MSNDIIKEIIARARDAQQRMNKKDRKSVMIVPPPPRLGQS